MNAQLKPMNYRELLIGCGNDKRKKVRFEGVPDDWQNLTTVDFDQACNPDVVHDLNVLPYPFENNSFDEVCAFEVLEHLGSQGDFKFFFDQFYELWRILKPGGYLIGTVPMWDSPWAWADPGHRRVITKESFIFLRQKEYEQLGKTAMADYRFCWKGDFETITVEETEHQMAFVLRAIK